MLLLLLLPFLKRPTPLLLTLLLSLPLMQPMQLSLALQLHVPQTLPPPLMLSRLLPRTLHLRPSCRCRFRSRRCCTFTDTRGLVAFQLLLVRRSRSSCVHGSNGSCNLKSCRTWNRGMRRRIA